MIVFIFHCFSALQSVHNRQVPPCCHCSRPAAELEAVLRRKHRHRVVWKTRKTISRMDRLKSIKSSVSNQKHLASRCIKGFYHCHSFDKLQPTFGLPPTAPPNGLLLLDLSNPALHQFYMQQRIFFRQIYAQQLAALSARLGLMPPPSRGRSDRR